MLMDRIGSYYGVAVWSSVEVNIAVISACLPTIRPFLQSVGQRLTKMASSYGGLEKFSRTTGLSKDSKSTKQSLKSSRQGIEEFQRLHEYDLDHVSAPEAAKVQGAINVRREPDLERGLDYR